MLLEVFRNIFAKENNFLLFNFNEKESEMYNTENERQMGEAFDVEAARILAAQETFEKDGKSFRVGLEGEVAVLSENCDEVESTRDSILEMCDGTTDIELGAAQIEFRTDPINLASPKGVRELFLQYYERHAAIVSSARVCKASVLRLGSNPFLPTINAPRTLRKTKYKLVPDFQNLYRRRTVNTKIGLNGSALEIGDASIVSLFQAFQVNIEAGSLFDVVDKTNRGLMIGPYLLAVFGNSRYLELRDTGFNDLRIKTWELSHDTRTEEEVQQGMMQRVGLPEGYFRNLEEYFSRIRRYPFILFDPQNALKIGIGLHWLDVRIKFTESSAIAEFRLFPTQPTIEEEIALTLFVVGRLAYSQLTKEPLLPFYLVKENRTCAMTRGLAGSYWYYSASGQVSVGPARDVISLELRRAEEGLSWVGVDFRGYFELVLKRIQDGSPSDVLMGTLKGKSVVTRGEMIDALIETGSLHGYGGRP